MDLEQRVLEVLGSERVTYAIEASTLDLVAGGYGLWRERPRRSAGQPQERPSAAVPHLD